jgi:hypothetical protein
VTIASVSWRGDCLALELGTPRGVSLPGRPVLSALLALVVGLLRGTRLAAWLFARWLPAGWRWDGRRVDAVVPASALPALLRGASRFTLRCERQPGGIACDVGEAGALVAVAGVLGAILQLALNPLAAVAPSGAQRSAGSKAAP